jgi:hypothetical protein
MGVSGELNLNNLRVASKLEPIHIAESLIEQCERPRLVRKRSELPENGWSAV